MTTEGIGSDCQTGENCLYQCNQCSFRISQSVIALASHVKQDEQHEHLIEAQHSNPDRDNLSEINWFKSTTHLWYTVLNDSSDSEIIPEIDTENQLEVSEQLLDRSIIETEEAWQELEYIADRLGNLSPLLSNENIEIELAQISKQ